MYRYFISFTHNTPEESGYGNVIVETNLEFSGGVHGKTNNISNYLSNFNFRI